MCDPNNPTAACLDYNHQVGQDSLSFEDHAPLLEMKYSNTILEQDFAEFAGLDFFKDSEVKFLQTIGDGKFAQSMRIKWREDESAFNNVQIEDVKYKDGETCPPQLDLECAPACISTTPSFCTAEIRFDKKYSIGVSWCVETEHLLFEDAQTRFNRMVEDYKKVYSVMAWNYLVCEAIANPADTKNPADAKCFPTHYVEAGSAVENAVPLLNQVIGYMKSIYGNRTDFRIFAHRYFEQDITSAQNVPIIHNITGMDHNRAFQQGLVQGGWRQMAPLGGVMWGEKVYIAPDTLDLYNQEGHVNPFLNDDMSKYYLIIASPRAFLTGITNFGDLHKYAATCDNPYESWTKSFMSYNYILRPEELFVIAFDVNCAI